ncbi:hypothetical protein EIP86_004220 [Pleurotus ostreatoroseus]|nr:hypothetical protein EIP86_004220 [Pleurotus ostreatoroseus]
MQLTPGAFGALLQTLNLTQGRYKPEPTLALLDVKQGIGADSVANLTLSHDIVQPEAAGFLPGEPLVLSSAGDVYAQTNPCNVPTYNAPPVDLQTFPPFDQAKANVYRYRRQQSVNLGSWFVHEQWMVPSVFACAAQPQVSEIDIANGWGGLDGARSVLEQHWDTFINQSDFQYLASIGINTVRLPIGYWTLGPDFVQGTPYENVSSVYENSWSRVVRTINLAGQAGIGVLVDLHGAPGSQNGQQHSGISDGQTNLFGNPYWINKTMDVLTFLMGQLGYVTNVVGIEILNEPQDVPSLPDFYTQAIDTMRSVSPIAASFPLYIHDGFNLDQFSAYVANRTDFVVVDHHSYFVFTPSDDAESASDHTADVDGAIQASLNNDDLEARDNMVVDEWSCALTDQSLQNEKNPDQARQDFCTAQANVYTNISAGWSFWSYRKEDCDDDPGWCFTEAVGNALPWSFFTYGVAPTTPEPSQLPDMSTLLQGMTPPTGTDFPSPSYPSPSPSPPPAFRRTVQSRPGRRAPKCTLKRRDGDIQNPLNPNHPNPPTSTSSSAPTPSAPPLNPVQLASERGYTDGFLTARIFALYSLSKLGFLEQYISDSIQTLGPNIVASGTEDLYHDAFLRGLSDGETVVAAGLGQS